MNDSIEVIESNILKFGTSCVLKMASKGFISMSQWENDVGGLLDEFAINVGNINLDFIFIKSLFVAEKALHTNSCDIPKEIEDIFFVNDIDISSEMNSADISNLYSIFLKLGVISFDTTLFEIYQIAKKFRESITFSEVFDIVCRKNKTTGCKDNALGETTDTPSNKKDLTVKDHLEKSILSLIRILNLTLINRDMLLNIDEVIEQKKVFDKSFENIIKISRVNKISSTLVLNLSPEDIARKAEIQEKLEQRLKKHADNKQNLS